MGKLGSLLGLWGRSGWGGGNGLWDVGLLLLGLADLDDIGVGGLGADLASGVMGQHDFHLQTNNSLAEEDVTNSNIDVLSHWMTSVNHQTIGELHCLGTLSTKLTRDNNLATFGTRLHDEAEDTIGGTADGKTAHKLVAHGLALGGGAQTTVGNLLSEELDLAVLHLETFLDSHWAVAHKPRLATFSAKSSTWPSFIWKRAWTRTGRWRTNHGWQPSQRRARPGRPSSGNVSGPGRSTRECALPSRQEHSGCGWPG